MISDQEKFEAWHARVLESLYDVRDAGISIATLAFPLLERYVRQKIRLPSAQSLNKDFYEEVAELIPGFQAAQVKQFWYAVRNGLLHQVTLQLETRSGAPLPRCALTHDIDVILATHNGVLLLHPVLFARRVIEVIRSDFHTFIGQVEIGPRLPDVRPMTVHGANRDQTRTATVSTSPLPILGTSTGPR